MWHTKVSQLRELHPSQSLLTRYITFHVSHPISNPSIVHLNCQFTAFELPAYSILIRTQLLSKSIRMMYRDPSSAESVAWHSLSFTIQSKGCITTASNVCSIHLPFHLFFHLLGQILRRLENCGNFDSIETPHIWYLYHVDFKTILIPVMHTQVKEMACQKNLPLYTSWKRLPLLLETLACHRWTLPTWNLIVSQLDSYSRMPELISARSPGCIRHGTGRIEQYDLCKHMRVGNLS